VANNAHSGEVKRWAVIVDDRKVIIGYRSSDRVRPTIVDLYDLDDRRLSFSADPEKWSGAFGAIRRFENAAAEGDAL
jgi:hypothetical protein